MIRMLWELLLGWLSGEINAVLLEMLDLVEDGAHGW